MVVLDINSWWLPHVSSGSSLGWLARNRVCRSRFGMAEERESVSVYVFHIPACKGCGRGWAGNGTDHSEWLTRGPVAVAVVLGIPTSCGARLDLELVVAVAA